MGIEGKVELKVGIDEKGNVVAGEGHRPRPATASTRRPREAMRQFKFSPARTQRRTGRRLQHHLHVPVRARWIALTRSRGRRRSRPDRPRVPRGKAPRARARATFARSEDERDVSPDCRGWTSAAPSATYPRLRPLHSVFSRPCDDHKPCAESASALAASLPLASWPRAPARAQQYRHDTTIDAQLFQPAIGPRNFLTVERPTSREHKRWASG